MLLLLVVGGTACSAWAEPSKVELVRVGEGWRLLVDGEPYRIRGAGGNHSPADLVEAGGNTLRTWGVGPETESILDEADRHGLKVMVGIWLGHTRHGFDYHDKKQTTAQLMHVREAVERFRDHPALLLWGLGNEMEVGENEGDPVFWAHLQEAAQVIQDLDPNHPVATVFAEIGGDKVATVQRLCPAIEAIGSNSYAGASSIPERYREAGGELPYLVTEFGPDGTWEVPKDKHGMVLEPTSTEKAGMYERSYRALEADETLCLGSFAFLWAHKQEATHTWFGMWLETGDKVASVDTMTRLWGGSAPENLCPRIAPVTSMDGTEGVGGQVLHFGIEASDPDGDDLDVTWSLYREANEYYTGGDPQARPGLVEGAVMDPGDERTAVVLPEQAGKYRLYVTVRDGRGGAATANVPLFVAER